MKRLDLTEAGFLLLEKRETPMHVGGVNLFTLPGRRGDPEAVLKNRVSSSCARPRSSATPSVTTSSTGRTGLFWEKDEHIDMDYHVRHSALPAPGRYRELFALASRLHTTLLDRTRPLWELHLIEGLQGPVSSPLTTRFTTRRSTASADAPHAGHVHRGPGGYEQLRALLREAYEASTSDSATAVSQLAPPKASQRNLRTCSRRSSNSMTRACTWPRRCAASAWPSSVAAATSPCPGTTCRARRSTRACPERAASLPRASTSSRVKALCKTLDATVNDIILALCAGALRRYLLSATSCPCTP
jgi:diacylglycerol O-acyltransferase